MRIFLLSSLICFLSILAFSQPLRVEEPRFASGSSSEWGVDNVLLPTEPAGGFYGIQVSNGDIYFAIYDTLSTLNLGLVIRKSTDQGLTWNTLFGINYRGRYDDIKLIKSSQDSVYCFFRIDYGIYSLNVQTLSINQVWVDGYRTYDVEMSSTNSIYIVLDSLATNNVIRYSSLNGGWNWINRGSISSSAAFPHWTKSLSGDTLFLNYYGPPVADTATSIIRVARYRETAPGVLASAGFQDLATEVLPKHEYKIAANNGVVWFIYSVAGAASEIWGRQSLDGGTSYAPAVRINGTETVNQYWFDIKTRYPAGNGFDLVYYSDSAQAGSATTLTDKILFGTSTQTGNTFLPFTAVNDYPAVYSLHNYKPVLVEMPASSNAGIAWVGESSEGKKLFWDTFLLIPVELVSFTASADDGSVVLQWSTATETNNRGFSVQKKTTGEWISIGFVNGTGTSTKMNSYTFTDNGYSSGKTYYRLKQVDFDGTFTYSGEIEVDNLQPLTFGLSQNFPNPFNPSTVINYQIPEKGNVSLKLFDILGNEVATLVSAEQEAGSYNLTFNASGLASGTYIYKLSSGENVSVRKMTFIK